jgi:hypothetical protein
MTTENDMLLEDIVVHAASLQSGTDVIPIRLVAEIRHHKPDLSQFLITQIIDDLEARRLGQIKAPQDDPGEREFLINFRGVSFAQLINEERRPKSLLEKINLWTRTDWMALVALIIAAASLCVSIKTLLTSS